MRFVRFDRYLIFFAVFLKQMSVLIFDILPRQNQKKHLKHQGSQISDDPTSFQNRTDTVPRQSLQNKKRDTYYAKI